MRSTLPTAAAASDSARDYAVETDLRRERFLDSRKSAVQSSIVSIEQSALYRKDELVQANVREISAGFQLSQKSSGPLLTVSCSLANVAGTAEPEYGPSAIKSVAVQTQETPYTELKREDLTWKAMDSTSVETQCFYITADDGTVAMAQVIYSNVGSVGTLQMLLHVQD